MFVALLRGINVGGNKIVKMELLKKALESLGFTKVKTLLASGNVVFEAPKTKESELTAVLEEKLKKAFGFEIPVLIRSLESLVKLQKSDPFKGIKVGKETRLYITFLSEKPKKSLKIPYKSEDGNFKILHASATEVCSVLTVVPVSRSVDLMAVVEDTYGKKVTTRNWNTVEKLIALG